MFLTNISQPLCSLDKSKLGTLCCIPSIHLFIPKNHLLELQGVYHWARYLEYSGDKVDRVLALRKLEVW